MPATYEPIASTTLGSDGQVTLNSGGAFSQYTDLVVVVFGRCSYEDTNTAFLRFNNDSNTNYSHTEVTGNGSTVTSTTSPGYSYIFAGDVARPSQTNSVNRFHIMSVNSTSVFKTVLMEAANPYNKVWRGVGLWRSTSAITSVFVGNNYGWKAGTQVTLYGIKAA